MINLQKYINIPQGDMPGDKIAITVEHVAKAEVIYPQLKSLLDPVLKEKGKAVVAVCGGSGVGKSEVGSLLAYLLNEDGIGAYIMSGDNYPHRIPAYNDAEREAVYAAGGREALKNYLGTEQEINFREVDKLLGDFKDGVATLSMKRMGRTQGELWYDRIDFSKTQVLILEWTHGNSDFLTQVDIPILLNSTPAETLEHRKNRNRDGGVDSPFTTMVLEIEQEKLHAQAKKAKLIVSKAGELLSYQEYCKCMEVQA